MLGLLILVGVGAVVAYEAIKASPGGGLTNWFSLRQPSTQVAERTMGGGTGPGTQGGKISPLNVEPITLPSPPHVTAPASMAGPMSNQITPQNYQSFGWTFTPATGVFRSGNGQRFVWSGEIMVDAGPEPRAGAITPQNYASHGWSFDASSGIFRNVTGGQYRWSGSVMVPL